jgi:alpha-beta hydrolase superfamily lysophospholipase
MCGFESQRARRPGMRANPFQLNDPERLKHIRGDLPVLLVAGDADPINRGLAGLQHLEDAWRAAGLSRIDRQFYPGGRHEMLNETNRDDVTANIIAWLDEVIGAAR